LENPLPAVREGDFFKGGNSFMAIFFWVLAALMLFFIVMQIRSRVPRIISFFTPGNRDLFFQDNPDPPIDEIHQEMIKPHLEKLETLGFSHLGLMLEKPPLWAKSSRELVLVSSNDKVIASIGFRGIKLSYFFYTPFEGGQVVVTAYNCFRNYVKPDFMTSEIKSGNLDEMLEDHKKDVADFVAKGYTPFNEYTREEVVRATNLYYKASYPSKQLRIAGVTNSLFLLLSLFVFYLLVIAALG
jgi:hypothetical protein